MSQNDWLAKKFEENHAHLRSVAYRILGSQSEAEDAIQEAWLRLTKSDSQSIENLSGWLTTVVARVCLDVLRYRKTRQEESLEEQHFNSSEDSESQTPEDDVLLAESIGPALLIVLETLAPAERVAFVLHDLFDLSFEEIAPVIGKSEMATRQLASRARRRIRGAKETSEEERQKRAIVSAFLKASREGDFASLLQLLDPAVMLRADEVAVKVAHANKSKGAPGFQSKMQGAQTIAELFKGKAAAASLALINGTVGSTWISGGKPRVAFAFNVTNGKITEIDIIMDPKDLSEIEVKPL
jgi:RNA polymerase sigma-70 factor (ECF subfamily)